MRLVDAWNRFWFSEGSLARLGLFRICILLVALYAVLGGARTNFHDAAGRDGLALAREWQPIYAFEVLGIEPPGLTVTRIAFAAAVAAIALGILGLFTRTSSALAAALTFYWCGLTYSFGQVHHEKVALIFALIALPLSPCGARYSIDALIARARRAGRGGDPSEVPEVSPFAGWALRFTQITVALGYFFAGATKLAISGIEWVNGYTLQAILLGKGSPWSAALSQSVELSMLMSAGLLAIQISFPLIFLHPVLRWFFVPGAITFHLLARMTMDTGSYFTLWGTLVCFVPLEQVPAFLKRTFTTAPMLGRAALAGSLAFVGSFVLGLYLDRLPAPLVGLLLMPIAAAVILALLPDARAELELDGSRPACRRLAAAICALDWAHRIHLVERKPAEGAVDSRSGDEAGSCWQDLIVMDAGGRGHTGFDAWRALARRLPALVWAASLLGLVPGRVRRWLWA